MPGCQLRASTENMTASYSTHDLRWHTNALAQMAMNPTRRDGFLQSERTALLEPTASQYIYKNSVHRSCLPRCHDNCLSSDNYINTDIDKEMTESAGGPSITCLNANSNGTMVKNIPVMTKTNNVDETLFYGQLEDETEIQLDTVGLSLSSSGMHLFVKADTDEKKKLLADTYVQLTAKPIKERANTNLTVNKQLLLTSEDAENVFATSDQHKKPSFNDSPQQAIKSHKYTTEYAKCRNIYPSLYMTIPATDEAKGLKSQMKYMPLLNRCDPQKTVAKNNEVHHREMMCKNKKPNYQRIHSQMHSTLKRCSSEEIGAIRQENKRKYTDSKVQRNKQKQLQLQHNQNYSSNNDDYQTGNNNKMLGVKINPMISPVCLQKEDAHQRPCVVNTGLLEAATSLIDTQPANLTLTQNRSPTLLHSTYPDSSPYDGVSISTFIDYANNIRKSIREDYRNISNLIKEFSDEMQTGHKNHSSQSGSDKPKKNGKPKINHENCIVM